jgi:hypothetical protein
VRCDTNSSVRFQEWDQARRLQTKKFPQEFPDASPEAPVAIEASVMRLSAVLFRLSTRRTRPVKAALRSGENGSEVM